MSRANPLPPDERRRALMDATLPLLRQHGLAVSTRQIAEAAGVAEGTIFRAFPSKTELIEATVRDATSPERVLAELDAAGPDLGLPALVERIVATLQERTRQTRMLFAMLGHTHDHPHHHDKGECRRPDLTEANARLAGHLAALLTPHAAVLRVDPATAAAQLLAFSFGSAFSVFSGGTTIAAADVAATLLTGLTKDPA